MCVQNKLANKRVSAPASSLMADLKDFRTRGLKIGKRKASPPKAPNIEKQPPPALPALLKRQTLDVMELNARLSPQLTALFRKGALVRKYDAKKDRWRKKHFQFTTDLSSIMFVEPTAAADLKSAKQGIKYLAIQNLIGFKACRVAKKTKCIEISAMDRVKNAQFTVILEFKTSDEFSQWSQAFESFQKVAQYCFM